MHIANVIISIISPPLGLPGAVWGLLFDRKHTKCYAISFAIFMATLAYVFSPNPKSDLARYFTYINDMRNMPLGEALAYDTYGANGQSLFLFAFICWCAARLDDPNLIPAASIFCIYYFAFNSMGTFAYKNRCRKKEFLISLLITLLSLNFYSLVNNIRNVLAFSMVCYAAYREFVLQKRDLISLCLYFMPISIHPVAMIFLGLRIVIKLSGKIKYYFCIILLFAKQIVGLLKELTIYFPENNIFVKIKFVINKAHRYFYETTSEWGLEVQASGSEHMFKFLYIFLTILIGIIIVEVLVKINKSGKEKTIRDYQYFYIILLFVSTFTVSTSSMFRPEYWRFANTLIVFFPVAYIGLKKYSNNLFSKCVNVPITVLSISIFILWVRNIIMYTNCTVTEMFLLPFICGPLPVFFKILFSIM